MKNSNLLNKIIFIILMLVLVFTIIPIQSNADSIDSVMEGAKSFVDSGKQSDNITLDSSVIKSASDMIYNILLGVGIVIALAVGSILGIQFMLASAEDKAKVKEALIPFIIGCIIIFGAFGIWKIVVIIGSNF